jgi:hypothetical protein
MSNAQDYLNERLAMRVVGHTLSAPRWIFKLWAAAMAVFLVHAGQDPFAVIAGVALGNTMGTAPPTDNDQRKA